MRDFGSGAKRDEGRDGDAIAQSDLLRVDGGGNMWIGRVGIGRRAGSAIYYGRCRIIVDSGHVAHPTTQVTGLGLVVIFASVSLMTDSSRRAAAAAV
jgi:hypothetical protein